MPGVVNMENGVQTALPTNHNRDTNGAFSGGNSYASQVNGLGAANGGGYDMVNGGSLGGSSSMGIEEPQRAPRMNDLPDEIQHITEQYVPLGMVLSRLAQKTHNELQAKILELAKMPLPAPAMNGNSGHSGSLPDDITPENLNKKHQLLNFITDTHAKWTKALIITAWSRKAATVSKLIDLFNLLVLQRKAVDDGIGYLINIKRDLTFARLPNPDLKTALQILSAGDAPWMPDFNYIEPPPLSPKEQLQWIEELNTLLSLRLNLKDHEKIPYHFRDYSIDSGRVTFKVQGEFEVDLTIADEDFEKQFWFIDFRFLFIPAPVELTDTLRLFLEARVNEVLEKDGLQGCYKFLHEFVLTHKITEYVRQAFELARGRWVDTLKVERLNRGMSIQYWTTRFPPDGPQSWILMGVHSGKKPGSTTDPKSTSHLILRWFKDGKEVKDVTIALDNSKISTEALLQRVIGKHVEHILSTIHGRLQTKGRFVRHEAILGLQISQDDPTESLLKMQLGRNDFVTVRIAPTSGLFSLSPQTSTIPTVEATLNKSRNPAAEGDSTLEYLRWGYTWNEISRRGKSMGWTVFRKLVKADDVKVLLKTKEPFQYIALKKAGWPLPWYVMLTMSLSGDKWWLVEVTNSQTGPQLTTTQQLPLSAGLPRLSEQFFSKLSVFSTVMISQIIDQKAMLQRNVKHFTVEAAKRSTTRSLKFPELHIKLSDILKPRQSHGARKVASWARDSVVVRFRNVQKPIKGHTSRRSTEASGLPENQTPGQAAAEQERLLVVLEARFRVADPSKFSHLTGNVERDVAFNPRTGVFALRLEVELGTAILETLAHRLQAIKRLVDCVDAIGRSNTGIKCERTTLTEVVFTYSDAIGRNNAAAQSAARRWLATLDLRNDRINMHLEKGNPHSQTLDLINNLLNSELGFAKVPQYLAFTLPVLKALDGIKDGWEELEMNEQGRIEIFPTHLDWFNVRYTLPGPNQTATRRLTLQLKLRERRSQHWWFVERREPGQGAETPEDEFKSMLSQVFESSERLWQSFVHSAACKTDDIAALLQALDAAVRTSRATLRSPNQSRKAAPVKLNRSEQGNVVVLD